MVIDMRIDSHSHIFSWDGVNYDYEQYPSLLEYQDDYSSVISVP